MLEPAICYEAFRTHDERFDGRLFVGVTSTRIYCRPVCRAGPPKFENCRFFASAAGAQEAGFRPCLRCRPESAPDCGSWRGTSNTVHRSLAAIEEGELDGNGASVKRLAERMGVGARQLTRLFKRHLGASPLAVAQTRRILLAKQLIHETRLPMSEIALASGFGSIRRFNEAFHDLYARPPSALRRTKDVGSTQESEDGAADPGVTVRLPYRAPYDWGAMIAHLGARSVDGVERVEGSVYARTFVHAGEPGSVEVSHLGAHDCLIARIRLRRISALPSLIARLRRAFDLAADLPTIGAHLARDPLLAPLIAARPGLRLPGAWDGFELAIRAILGQQISVQAARQLAGKLVRLCGGTTRLPASTSVCGHAVCAPAVGACGGCALTATFPGPEHVAAADLTSLPMPGARRRALVTLAESALREPRLFHPLDSVEQTVARLRAIPGIGDWTAHYIALRAAREPDAFPAGDVGLLRGAARSGGQMFTAKSLAVRAERWRPFRAYAAQHLWTSDGETKRRRTGSEGRGEFA